MRLHEYLIAMTESERIRFRQWQILKSREIYLLKQATVTDKKSTLQQLKFETLLIDKHKEYIK